MNTLLNISTHHADLEIINHDWGAAKDLLSNFGCDGFELYPVGMNYPYKTIPSGLVKGLHLRFFIILDPIWRNDKLKLHELFGSQENLETFYGGSDKEAIINYYHQQLELAAMFDVPYVVFHPVHYELDYVYNWNPPWDIKATMDLSVDVINTVMEGSSYKNWVLYENLWWPGNFRLDEPWEIDYLLSKTRHPKTGIVLDTGHVLNKNHALRTEQDGIEYLLKQIGALGEQKAHIKAVHLTKSLSGRYVQDTLNTTFASNLDFWEKLTVAARHVRQIDQHNAFEDQAISGLFDLINPEHVVFEFAYRSLEEWQHKIRQQKQAMASVLNQEEALR
jgi:sugar phosphate isomerase/epimerase